MFGENVTLSPQEITYIRTRNKRYQLAFAILLKYYQQKYEFIEDLTSIPQMIINRISQQLQVSPKLYLPSKRSTGEFYSLIRGYFKSSFPKSKHAEKLTDWIKKILLPSKFLTHDEIYDRVINYQFEIGIESLTDKVIHRIIKSAIHEYQCELNDKIYNSQNDESIARLNGLLLDYKDKGISAIGWINKDITNPALQSMLNLLDQLALIEMLNINFEHIKLLPKSRLSNHADAFTRLNPSDLKTKDDKSRCASMVMYCYTRRQQITDRIIDMFMRISHDIVFKSERRVVKKLISHIKKVYGKGKVLFDIAEACILEPNQSVKDVIFPIANQNKLPLYTKKNLQNAE